ncbi:MAG: AzlD domain-containing protein [Salinarimonas sp.]|nr:AzlD domain-containing protein [Salinarimonas sp.]
MTAFEVAIAPLWPYLVLIMVGFLPSEVWRALGVVVSRGLDERSEIIVWVRAVATTLLAAVVMKLLLTPTGALAAAPILARFGAVVAGVGVYFLARRSVIAGVIAGELILISVTYFALA